MSGRMMVDMNIGVLSFGDYGQDGRLRSFIEVLSKLGTGYCYTRGIKPVNNHSKIYSGGFMGFCVSSIHFIKNVKKGCKLDVIFLDNRKACVPGLVLSFLYPEIFFIQDCRELYLLNETFGMTGKIGCVFEQIMARRADLVICANKSRADITKKAFRLKNSPLVYENYRKLEYEDKNSIIKAKEKLNKYFIDEEIRIVSLSGCSIFRTNDVLAKNIKKVTSKCRLFLVGDSNKKDRKVIEKILKENKINNVVILDMLNQSELKYLIQNSHIGIVNYNQKDTNNRLCASGKLYEFIYEGIPVVTTTNPTLKTVCDRWNVGIADDQYFDGINRLIEQYDYYKNQTIKFSETNTVASKNSMLLRSLKDKVIFK